MGHLLTTNDLLIHVFHFYLVVLYFFFLTASIFLFYFIKKFTLFIKSAASEDQPSGISVIFILISLENI